MPDPTSAARLREVCLGAAYTLDRLTDMDLLRYESPVTAGSADLATWEEMAPVVASTLLEVNAFVGVVRQQLERAQDSGQGDLAALVDATVAELGGDARQRLDEVFRASIARLSEQVQALGAKVREPSIVSDRWNLLAEVQAARNRFREEIGTVVFEGVSLFSDVEREEVVPGHAQEVQGAVTVRASVADLRRVLEARGDKVRVAEPEDVQWHAQQLEKEMDAFGRTAAYRALRAQDKRRIIEYRHQLRTLARERLPGKAEVIALCLQFLSFVQGLAVVNQRALLVQHDREIWARSGVKLEQAGSLVEKDPGAAALALAEAADLAVGLYGRNEALDEFLRQSRKRSLALLASADLRGAAEDFRTLLAALSLVD
jgi:hypothetical protein